MKKQVNPAIFIVLIVVALGIIGYFGWNAANPAPGTDAPKSADAASRPTEINGHPVPKNVPVDLMQKAVNQGGGGYQGSGAPGSMMGGAQHP